MDIELNFTECGSGQVLILLHGNGEDSGYFKHQIEYFSSSFRVIAIDTRGHGRSPRGTAPFTISQFADDLCHFMRQHDIERAHILGFSDGANIAMVFAIRYPHMVDRLILNGGNLSPSGVKRSVQLPIDLGYQLTGFFARYSAEALRNHELLGLMAVGPDIPVSELKKLNCKTLVIAGTKDMIKESHTRQIAKAIPGAQLRIIPGDHFIANKKPREFNAVVDVFLR